ncbi:MAG: ABC transporter permease subunit [Propionibacteriaceae bacterium]|jgi:peptide/nickel transport system permease protein|nr:ABC transporter permease subunit [Propionibacteriaceae bacterium]
MIRFLARRFALALGTLFVLSVVVHLMVDTAADPLDDLRTSTAPNKEVLIASRVAMLQLDAPWITRYWNWLHSFIQGDFGIAWRSQQKVSDLMVGAVSTSVSLILFATLLALLLGITVGIVSALRQYTTFDYSITFVSFMLYSLPVFWVAVLLKQFLAIGLNDFLADPGVNWLFVIAVAVVSGLFWAGALGGRARRKLVVFGTAAAVTLATLLLIVWSGWLDSPQIGPLGLGVLGAGTALAVTLAFAGLSNRRALYSALATAAVGLALYYPLMYLFYYYVVDWPLLFGLLALAIACGCGVGWLFGGTDRGVSMRGGAIVAAVMAALTFVDRVMQVYPMYYRSNAIHGRPIATIGAETPNLGGDFWVQCLDRFTHILLPTIALVLISFASYTRYQRGAMLEVLSKDYIRTARAKGLSERVVIVRHALRNALMPLAAVIPVDLVAMIGGAVMTETIFGWAGMGKLFIDSLRQSEVAPIMAYVMITGAVAIIANLAADFFYALLDPRIRVNA